MTEKKLMPVIVIGGFLGAGKTSVVNHLLRNANGKKIAILVNDFGEISIDANLIESAEKNIWHVAGGCICCNYGSDLIGSLNDIDSNANTFDLVLIETSGVSLPYPIACSVSLIPSFFLKGIVVLVNSTNFTELLEDPFLSDTLLRQLFNTNLIVINKLDLISQEKKLELTKLLQDLSPKATTIHTFYGKIEVRHLLELFEKNHALNKKLIENKELSITQDINLSNSQIRLHNPRQLYDSQTYEMPNYYDFTKLRKILCSLNQSLLRVKIIAQDEERCWKLLSMAQNAYTTSDMFKKPNTGYGVLISRKNNIPKINFATIAKNCEIKLNL